MSPFPCIGNNMPGAPGPTPFSSSYILTFMSVKPPVFPVKILLTSSRAPLSPPPPPPTLLHGLETALPTLTGQVLPHASHPPARRAEATWRAVAAGGRETVAQIESERSNSLTAVLLPEGYDADAFRGVVCLL